MRASDVSPDFVPWAPGRDEQDPANPALLTEGDSLLITFGFHCNLACTFCLVEDALDHFGGISVEQFEAWLTRPSLFQGVRRIILSGGEATMEKDLFRYVELARKVPNVEHVRIQTNGTRLGQRDYLQSLIDAGVDEYFVSLHAHDEALNTKITQRRGSFHQIMAGIQAVSESTADLYVNTAIVTDNYEHLAAILERSAPYNPLCHSVWYNFLRVNRADTRQMMPRMSALLPHLLHALDRGDELGLTTLVKWVPKCWLGKHRDKHDDSQPTTLVDGPFWDDAPGFSCLYRNDCAMGGECTGIMNNYIHTYGWEEDLLRPERVAPPRPANHHLPLELSPEEVARAEVLLHALGLKVGAEPGGFLVKPPTRVGDALRLPLVRGGVPHWLELTKVVPSGRYFAKNATLGLSYGKTAPEHERAFALLLAHLRRRLERSGPLRLPWWSQV